MPPADVDAWSDALIELLSDRTRTAAMARAGRKRAIAEFGEQRFVDRIEQAYGQVVAAAARPRPGS